MGDFQSAFETGMVIGAIITGCIVGAIPMFTGIAKGKPGLGIGAFFSCLVCQFILGMILSLPCCAIFMFLICKKEADDIDIYAPLPDSPSQGLKYNYNSQYAQQPMYQQPIQQPMYQQPIQQPMYQQPVQQQVYQQPAQQAGYTNANSKYYYFCNNCGSRFEGESTSPRFCSHCGASSEHISRC